MAGMTSSVSVVLDEPAETAALHARVAELRRRFSRAIIDPYLDKLPVIAEGVFVAPGAALVGEVHLGSDVSVWYGCVLRGDLEPVIIGDRTNLQDGSVFHVADRDPCVVGADVVIGHRAVVHACRIEDACLIGMQATILDEAVIGTGSIVGAGAVVTPRTIVPPRSLVLGVPGKVVRTLDEDTPCHNRALAAKYLRMKEDYLGASAR